MTDPLFFALSLPANHGEDGGWADDPKPTQTEGGMSWSSKGLCQFLPAERWDTEGDTNLEALRVCLACPVRRECAETAIAMVRTHDFDACIWGATTPSDRNEVRRYRKTLEQIWAHAAKLVEKHDRGIFDQLYTTMREDAREALWGQDKAAA